MQTQRSTLSPLAIVTPMPHRRSSLLSMNSAASPRTPRSCPSPSLYYPANRKSTDSWNSSNADDMDVEWKQEHVLLLSRTLDALPAHLVTPFNGPIPPSNLLDKIARGVSQAKGPQDWPYSIRATRAKLLELARTRAREEALDEQRRHDSIAEEIEIDDGSSYSYFHDGEDNPIRSVGIGPRRPLYRQSSMDFIKPRPTDLKDNPNIARLSNRLQRSDRVFPNPSYHPYSRIPRPQQGNRRSSSPPHPTDVPALINPSTPSSSTLNSLSSISSAPRGLRRSSSTISSSSLFSANSADMPLADPRIQRLKRSDSLCSDVPPAPPPKDFPASRIGFKRAPSYGTLAQEVRQQTFVTDRLHERKLSGSYPSSDEEEKARTRHAKKLKTKTGPVQSVNASAHKSSSGSESSSPTTPQANPVKSSNTLVSSGRGDSRPIGLLESPAIQLKVPVRKPEANGHKSKKSGSAILELGLGLLLDKKGESKIGAAVPKSRSSVKTEDRSKTGKSGGGKDKTHRSREGSKDIDADMEKPNKTIDQVPKRPLPMNLQRNPSMFGAELPPLKSRNNIENKTAFGSMLSNDSSLGVAASIPMLSPAPLLTSAPSTKVRATKRSVSPSSPPTSPVSMHRSITSPASKSIFELTSPPSPTPTQLNSPCLSPPLSPCSVSSPTNHRLRTLRRVRRLPPNAPGRRISFGSLRSPDHAPGDEADMEGDGEAESMLLSSPMTSKRSRGLGLGSAFQLH